jgi:hypothetical protein
VNAGGCPLARLLHRNPALRTPLGTLDPGMWLNLGIAAILLIATIIGFYLAHRWVKGE